MPLLNTLDINALNPNPCSKNGNQNKNTGLFFLLSINAFNESFSSARERLEFYLEQAKSDNLHENTEKIAIFEHENIYFFIQNNKHEPNLHLHGKCTSVYIKQRG